MRGARLPDFFIAGGPRCGTTALYAYLREHPGIFMPKLKEPQYFCTDFPGLAQVADREAYLELFRKAPAGSRVGEASVWYLYSREALPRIMARLPEARIVVMARNPVDMAYSLHAHLLLTLQEDVEDFATAWRLQGERRQGRRLPAYCPDPGQLQYRDICRLGSQLERALEVVPRRQLHVILFDHFVRDTRTAYESALAFLGLPTDGRTQFPPVNPSSRYRSSLVAALRQPPRPLRAPLYRTVRLLNRAGIRPLRLLRAVGAETVERPPLAPELRAELCLEFRQDVAQLESLLEVDLRHWLAA